MTAATTNSVAVIAIRDDGRRVLYSHAANREAAKATVAALARVHLKAEIRDDIDPHLRPGTSVPEPVR